MLVGWSQTGGASGLAPPVLGWACSWTISSCWWNIPQILGSCYHPSIYYKAKLNWGQAL